MGSVLTRGARGGVAPEQEHDGGGGKKEKNSQVNFVIDDGIEKRRQLKWGV